MKLRKNLFWLAIVIITALIQSTWPDMLKIQGVTPDLTLLLVVFFAMLDGEERAMFTGVLGGVYQDVASETVLGHHVICLVIVGYMTGRLSTRLIANHPAVQVGLVFGAGMVHGIIYTSIAYVQRPDISALYNIGVGSVPAAFYTALITPFVYFALAWLFPRPDSFIGKLG
jgi:rod shape-determining protein MreD